MRYTNLRADLTLIPPGPAPALPERGKRFRDPAFGVEILRVTDERDGTLNGTSYSYWPMWNADTTRLLCHSDGKAFVYEFDAKRFRARDRRPAAPECWHEDLCWSGINPVRLFGRAQNAPATLLLATDSTLTRLWDAANEFPGAWLTQISISDDERRVAATLKRDSADYAVLGYVVRDLAAVRTILHIPCEPGAVDEVRLSRCGRYLTAIWPDPANPQPSQRNRLLIHYLETGATATVLDEERAQHHFDADSLGVYGRDNWQPALSMRPFVTPELCPVLLGYDTLQRAPWEHDGHVSARGPDTDWVLVSDQSATQNADVLGDEIYLVHTPTASVRRVCHHRARATPYEAHPFPVLSPCGRFAAFGSGWDGTLGEGRKDLFVVRLEE